MFKRLIEILILVTVVDVSVGADTLEISYVGAITDNLHSPMTMAVSGDYLAVLDPYLDELSLYTPDGFFTRKVSLRGEAYSLAALRGSVFLILGREERNIYTYDVTTGQQSDFVGNYVGLADPVDLDYDGRYVSVLDAGQSMILEFDSDGLFVGSRMLKDDKGQKLSFPSRLACDRPRNKIYILDQINSRVLVFDGNGAYDRQISAFGNEEGQISRGGDIAVTGEGILIVSDRYQGRVSAFGRTGEYLRHIRSENNIIASGYLPLATGISTDPDGYLYLISNMAPSVQIYHIRYRAYAENSLTAIQERPEDRATISGQVTMVAGVTSVSEIDKIAGIEFQLFEDIHPDIPLRVSPIMALGPAAEYPGTVLMVAEWSPPMDLEDSSTYLWRSRVHAVDTLGEWSAMRSFTYQIVPDKFRLDQNFPNPFNAGTTISFALPQESDVSLEVIDLLGRRIKTLWRGLTEAGIKTMIWDGSDDEGNSMASGIYFYRLKAGDFVETKKMAFIK